MRVRIVGRSSGHGVKVGTIGTITSIDGSHYYLDSYSPYFHEKDIEPVAKTLEELKRELEETKAMVEEITQIIVIAEAEGMEELDQDVIKAYRVLNTLKGEGTDLAKAKAIIDIIR